MQVLCWLDFYNDRLGVYVVCDSHSYFGLIRFVAGFFAFSLDD